ncbi:MAG: hypothetical protein FWD11_00590 [Micrococcales bacterium]|nr:hypothetical protein [Micrococcales bacterium]
MDSAVLVFLMLGIAGWGVLVIRRWPTTAVFGYLAVLMFLPAWLLVPLGPLGGRPVVGLVGLGVVLGMFGLDAVRPTTFDVVLVGYSAVIIVTTIVGLVDPNTLYWLLMWWVLPYLVARTLATRTSVATVCDAVTVLIAVVVVLAVVESVNNANFFNEIFATGDPWERLQYRGGRVRVEGAFGHSIALGAVLGMSVPMVWASRWRPWFRVATLAGIGVAAMLTFSRIGMLTTMLALAASFVLLRAQMPARVRWTILAVGGVVALILVPTVMQVFDDGSEEVSGSGDYRFFLLRLIPKLALFGEATSPDVQLASIDNELLLTGIRVGILPLGLLLVCGVVGVVMAIRRPNPGLIAAAVMLPGLTSVAFITQFTAFFWFAVGLGVSGLVAEQAKAAAGNSSAESDGVEPREPPEPPEPPEPRNTYDLLRRSDTDSSARARAPGG